MHFLADESTGPDVAEWLTTNGHEVFSVYDESQGMSDYHIVQKAFNENWMLITNDAAEILRRLGSCIVKLR